LALDIGEKARRFMKSKTRKKIKYTNEPMNMAELEKSKEGLQQQALYELNSWTSSGRPIGENT